MIYFDNAATTQMLPEAADTMMLYLTRRYGNASTLYGLGQESRAALTAGRETMADLIGAERDEIFFTSGGSESDNWALKGACDLWESAHPGCKPHIITTGIEHEAVLQSCAWLEKHGTEITRLEPDGEGFIRPEEVEKAIRPQTALISVMTANNEIGTIEPVAAIGEIARRHGILFHTDAVQAFGQIPLDVRKMKIDLLSASSHKLYGPKGVGLLYIRKGILLPPLIHGGGQERGRRGGTENIPGIAGFAKAAEHAGRTMEDRRKRESGIRDYMIRSIRRDIPDVLLNGPDPEDGDARRLPGNVNFCIGGIDGETLLTMLDLEGVCASSGSACSSGSLDPSHVLLAIGRSHVQARGSLRLSIGAYNTMEEAAETVKILSKDVQKLRAYT